MSQIYKLNHIQGEEIKHIYIFSNDISIATPEYVDSQGQPVFTTDEKENIDAKNIPVDIITATQFFFISLSDSKTFNVPIVFVVQV